MKHLFTLALSGAFAAGISAVAAQTAWDMPTPYGDSVFHTQNIMQFADDVADATEGELTITVHSAGSLYAHPEIRDSVRRGLAPIGEILMSQLANEDAVFGVDSVPFLAASYDDAQKLWEASRDQISARLAEQGLTLLFAVPWPGQSLYLTEEVTSIEQMKGVSFRAYNTATERLAQLMGAVPTTVEAGDIPTAFSTSRVKAMITSPSTGVSSQAWDFVSHYIDTQAWLPKNMVFVNTRAFEALPEDQQEALREAAAAAEARGWQMSREETAAKIATLKENGMQVSAPSDTLAAELREIGATMTEEWKASAGDAGLAILSAYQAR
ncbi:TRAP-type C4-dicarboxylate transport system, substrate-binding protein [Roseovarius azorensis]|uniref:TRAP-type C4-dicarboxylate transport system, substrate-binding protein n=1 Tax=Roseovarius azorensis TaxID=1287727 RepID=A0A1H7Q7M2_9RHOB|nr:TRAP transporter substrate-binding protein [Roseovarius azorensis]SEL43654.1 TRAP-type C4-dicarboxylate transport system, substrate-binding protein [Roseovarius azorensis]